MAGCPSPRNLGDPDLTLLAEWLATGVVRHVTLAPERPGALDAVSRIVAKGASLGLGQTDADVSICHAPINRGARTVTHVHNAHRRFAPRDPGPAGVALARAEVAVTLIADLVHLAPETVLEVFAAAAGRTMLITDAMTAAGLGDGAFRFGPLEVTVDGMQARLADGRLAGSVLTMAAAVRNIVGLGVPLPAAVDAATRIPAWLLGHEDRHRLRPGDPANLLVLDEGANLTGAWWRGRPVRHH